jgi:AAA ATPase domain
MIEMANRTKEVDHFMKMLSGQCAKRILLVQGPSGYGKTKLLSKLGQSAPSSTCTIPIDLKAASSGVVHVFGRVQKRLGIDNFPRFNAELENIFATGVEIHGNRLSGQGNCIEVVLQADPETRAFRLSKIQRAFFEDLRCCNRQIVIILDTFNEATEELSQWISGSFLAEVAESQNLLAVVAGQTVPQSSIEWHEHKHCYQLEQIEDHEVWHIYAKNMGLPFDRKELEALVDCIGGIPAEITKFLDRGSRARKAKV